jgi:hypothetical protein
MVVLLLTTTISCSDAFALLQRISKNVILNEQQKTEIISELRQTIPFCPIKVEKNAK